jgi:hypothetical protein
LNGVSTSFNSTKDRLANFIPNEFSRYDLLKLSIGATTQQIGSWTDSRHAVTTARPSFNESRECFAAVAVETLGACAAKCLEEGAPIATEMAANTFGKYECKAFAYHRQLNLCVRLPAFAADAKYTPTLRQWNGNGWQNFVYKYFGHFINSPCKAHTLIDIQDGGYDIVRNKNNGHLYLKCSGTPKGGLHKASCVESECPGKSWCFVPNHCGSFFKKCKALPNQNPLKCK